MKLAAYLKLHNLTQFHFAVIMGVSPPTVHCWVQGIKTPHSRTQKKIFKKTKGQISLQDWKTNDKKHKKL